MLDCRSIFYVFGRRGPQNLRELVGSTSKKARTSRELVAAAGASGIQPIYVRGPLVPNNCYGYCYGYASCYGYGYGYYMLGGPLCLIMLYVRGPLVPNNCYENDVFEHAK